MDSTTLSHAWLYLALRHSAKLYNSSTCMCLLDFTSLYHGSTWLYLTLLHSTIALLCSTPALHYYMLQRLYLALLDTTVLQSTKALLGFTCLYYNLQWLYLTLLDSTTLDNGSTWVHLTLLHSIIAILGSTWSYYTQLCYTLPFTPHWHYLTLLHLVMTLLGYTWPYYTLPWLYIALLDSTSSIMALTCLSYTLQWFYLALTLLHPTMDLQYLFGSTWH